MSGSVHKRPASPGPRQVLRLSGVLCVLLLLPAALSACKPKKMSRVERCKKGCDYRLACIEEIELDKAVTEANRAVVRDGQKKRHAEYLRFCVKKCVQGERRFVGYASCGVAARTCRAFFRCARSVERASSRPRARPDPRPRARPHSPPSPM